MSNPNSLDELFQRPLDLPDSDAMTAEIMRQVAHVERRRKALLGVSGLAGTGVAAGIVYWANVLPAISSGVLPTLGEYFGRVGTELAGYVAIEPLSSSFALGVLAAASLVAMGLAAARFIHEP
jgi:hypothetical protein